MKRMTSVIIGSLLCLSATNALNAAQTAPRLVFKKGETLTYRFSHHVAGKKGSSAGSSVDMDGTAILQVLSVQKDGTAKIKMTTSGKGSMAMDGESMPLESEGPSRILFTVKPNGTITGLMDTQGRKTTLLSNLLLWDPGSSIQVMLISRYALFGLQLPDKLPARGGKWTGYVQEEDMNSVDFESDIIDPSKVKLKRIPVTFTYLGKGKLKGSGLQGSTCLAFRYENPLSMHGVKVPLPFTVYLDEASGRLLGLKAEKKSSDFTYKITVTLAKS